MVKLIKRILIFSLFFSLNLYGSDDAGYLCDFIDLGIGARTQGMGATGVSCSADVMSIYSNSANLANLKFNQLMTTTVKLFENTDYYSLGGVIKFKNNFGVGLAVLSLISKGFEAYDESGNYKGKFSLKENALLLSAGKTFFKNLSLGTTIKFVKQDIYNYSETGYGADIGIAYSPYKFINIGLNYQNLIQPELGVDKIPRNIKFGITIKLFEEKVNFNLEMDKRDEMKTDFFYGVEIWDVRGWPFDRTLGIRAGINSDANLSLGFTIEVKQIQFDYAMVKHDIEMLNYFSISYLWNKIQYPKPDIDKPQKFQTEEFDKYNLPKMEINNKIPVTQKYVDQQNSIFHNFAEKKNSEINALENSSIMKNKTNNGYTAADKKDYINDLIDSPVKLIKLKNNKNYSNVENHSFYDTHVDFYRNKLFENLDKLNINEAKKYLIKIRKFVDEKEEIKKYELKIKNAISQKKIIDEEINFYKKLAVMYFQSEKYYESYKYWKKILKLKPADSNALKYKKNCEELLGINE
jgi:hypothetical protein